MNKIQHRTIEIQTREASTDARTVPVSISSEFAVDRHDYIEVLAHDASAIDLSRAPLPLIEEHNGRKVNIGIIENLKVVGGKLRGLLRLGQSARATDLWPDIRDGIVTGLSVGYEILEYLVSDDDKPTIRATRWRPYETTILGVPADPSIGINRGHPIMTDKTDNVVDFEKGKAEGQRLAQTRMTEVTNLFAPFRTRGGQFAALEIDAIREGWPLEKTREALFQLLAGNPEPIASDLVQQEGSSLGRGEGSFNTRGMRIEAGRDDLPDFERAATDAVLIRSGVPVKDPHPATRDISRMRLSDIAEVYLSKFGRATGGMSREAIIRSALTTRGMISHSSSDFPRLLENISTKALMVGFEEAQATHRAWTRVGTMPDFKEGRRVALSDFDDLEVVYENGEYKHGSFSDHYATVQLAKYGKLFSISWESLVNDETQSFTQVPRGMAQAAIRTEADLVYAVLTGGTSLEMPDGESLFDSAAHNNYVSSGAAPGVQTLDAGFAAMGTQRGPKGAHLNITPRFLIVPRALEATGRALATSTNDPAGDTIHAANPFYQRIEVVADSRLDAHDPATWYLMADPMACDTIERVYLDGQESPYLETENGWNVDGTSFKVRHVVGVTALDWRGAYRNDGN